MPHLIDELERLAALVGAPRGAQPRRFDEPGLQRLARLPQLAVVDAVDGVPRGGLGAPLGPVRAEMAVVELVHLLREPRADVNAVGDVADRHLFLGSSREERRPHGARDLAVQRRHRVGAARQLQREHRHAEAFVADRTD